MPTSEQDCLLLIWVEPGIWADSLQGVAVRAAKGPKGKFCFLSLGHFFLCLKSSVRATFVPHASLVH